MPYSHLRRENDGYMNDLYAYLYELHFVAEDVGDDLVKTDVTENVLYAIHTVRKILNRFKEKPDASLDEIAEKLHCTRAGLYMRLASCGIDSPMFLRDRTAHIADFMKTSNRVYGKLIGIIRESKGDYQSLLEALHNTDEREVFVDWEVAYGLRNVA